MVERVRTPADDIILVTTQDTGVPQKILAGIQAYGHGNELDTALANARMRLRKFAHEEYGADAVVALTCSTSFAISPNAKNYYVVVLMGTAVQLPWPAGHGDPDLGLAPETVTS